MARFSGRLLASARVRAAPHFQILTSSSGRRSKAVLRTAHDPQPGSAFHLTDQTAEFITSLRRPALIPAATADPRAIARLVLDGLLEIEVNGRFRSGVAAHRVFFPRDGALATGDVIARLSLDALAHAVALGPIGAARLGDRLYRYNTGPLSPAWRQRFPDAAAVAHFLAGRRGTMAGSVRVSDVWLVTDGTRGRRPARRATHYKLYVSPATDATPEAYHALNDLLGTRHGPFTLKVARDLPTLLRPDKLVAHFVTRSDLLETARRLRTRLDGMPAQGVPFTAALGPDGLLSWGADLEPDPGLPSDTRDRSWRSWLTTRLGRALATASRHKAHAPALFAIDRVSLDGVNPSTWEPTADLLRGAADLSPPVDADS